MEYVRCAHCRYLFPVREYWFVGSNWGSVKTTCLCCQESNIVSKIRGYRDPINESIDRRELESKMGDLKIELEYLLNYKEKIEGKIASCEIEMHRLCVRHAELSKHILYEVSDGST